MLKKAQFNRNNDVINNCFNYLKIIILSFFRGYDYDSGLINERIVIKFLSCKQLLSTFNVVKNSEAVEH